MEEWSRGGKTWNFTRTPITPDFAEFRIRKQESDSDVSKMSILVLHRLRFNHDSDTSSVGQVLNESRSLHVLIVEKNDMVK